MTTRLFLSLHFEERITSLELPAAGKKIKGSSLFLHDLFRVFKMIRSCVNNVDGQLLCQVRREELQVVCFAGLVYPVAPCNSICGVTDSTLVYEFATTPGPFSVTWFPGQVFWFLQLIFLARMQQLVFVTLEFCCFFKSISSVKIISNCNLVCRCYLQSFSTLCQLSTYFCIHLVALSLALYF